MNIEIANFVKTYLVERGASLDEESWQDFDVVSSGVIDSFEILSFLLVLNNRYAIGIRPEDFVGADYNRLGRLVEYIEEKLNT